MKEPINIERIDAEVNGKCKMPIKEERARHIGLAEEGNPKVPVFTDYKNVRNIFDECNNDVDIFLEKYPETRILSKEEVLSLYAYCQTSQKFQFPEEVILGTGRSVCYRCIFKIEDDRWIIWNTDERRGFYNAQVFNNVKAACTTLIELQNADGKEFECRDYFESFLIKDYWHPNYSSNEKLEEFAKDFSYEISKTRTLKK